MKEKNNEARIKETKIYQFVQSKLFGPSVKCRDLFMLVQNFGENSIFMEMRKIRKFENLKVMEKHAFQEK